MGGHRLTRRVGIGAVWLVVAVAAMSGCDPSTEPEPTPGQAAAIVRAEVRSMATALGHNVTDYQEKAVPCDAKLSSERLQFVVNLRLTADPDKVAAMRTGYLATKATAGWTVRDDTTADHLGWTITDLRSFAIGYFVFPVTSAATVSGGGPCLSASVGKPTPQTWPAAP